MEPETKKVLEEAGFKVEADASNFLGLTAEDKAVIEERLKQKRLTIDEAVQSLKLHLNDDEIFKVRHDGTKIVVDVALIYRVEDVTKLNNVWEGYPLTTGRKSCW